MDNETSLAADILLQLCGLFLVVLFLVGVIKEWKWVYAGPGKYLSKKIGKTILIILLSIIILCMLYFLANTIFNF